MAVAAFGDGALPPFGAAAVFAGDEAEVAHELARVLEAAEVAQLGGGDHAAYDLKPFECHEGGDLAFSLPGLKEFLHVVFEAIDAVVGGVNGEDVFFEDDFLDR